MSNMRISGFNSGLDIDAMVKQLMKAERTKLDKLKQSQTTITWQQEQYRDISTSLVDFRNNKLSKYNTQSALGAKTASVSGNADALSIVSTNSAAAGSLNITVEKLASSANALYKTGATSIDGNSKMSDLNLPSAAGEITIESRGIPYKYNYNQDDKVSDIVNKINADKSLNATLMIGADGKLSIRDNKSGSNSLVLGGDFEFDEIDVINNNSGNQAEYTVNGIKMSSSTNSVSVNGYNLLLKGTSTTTNSTTVTARIDTDGIMNTIKSFITDYNALLDQVNGKLSEARYRAYKPLTDDQRSEMKDKEIELWEKKATSGLIKDDSILSSMVSDMRQALITKVNTGNESIKTVQSIGIVTGQWSDKGKLVIQDEQKLRAAIESNPDEVIALFNRKDSSSTNTNISMNEQVGVFTRLSEIAMKSLQLLSDKAGTSAYSADKNATFMANSLLGEQLRTLDNKIGDMNSYLARKENQYYKQFTAMETAINRYSSQSSSFSSFL